MQGVSSNAAGASASTHDVRLRAETSVRVTSELKAGRSVLLLGSHGRRIAHAALDSRDVTRVSVGGTASFEPAIRVTIMGAEGRARQSYALVHNTSARTRFVTLVWALKTVQPLSGNSGSRGTLTNAVPSFPENACGGPPRLGPDLARPAFPESAQVELRPETRPARQLGWFILTSPRGSS